MSLVEIDIDFVKQLMREAFENFVKKMKTNTLHSSDKYLPKMLLKEYYGFPPHERNLDEFKENFIKHYIECESIIEDTHELFEKEGLRAMYDYIHSKEINENFNIYTLLDLHRKLYSKARYPEAGGLIRNAPAYIDGFGIDLCPYSDIWAELKVLEPEVNDLVKIAPNVTENSESLTDFIDRCVELKCKLIKIHPFFDGNGRSIRGFINTLFLMAGLPSIYISIDENNQYRAAMQKAIGDENNFEDIKQFYYYKLCDSIVELDINPNFFDSISIPQVILESAQKWQNYVVQNNLSGQEAEIFVYNALKKQLEELNINVTICETTGLDGEKVPHYFMVAYYNEKFDEGKILVDPFFKNEFLAGNIMQNDSEESRIIAQSLFKAGAKNINNVDINNYIRLFRNFEKVEIAETSKAIVLRKRYNQKELLQENR